MKRGLFAVDLFCGIGGLTHGLQTSGIDVVAGIDFDPSCKYAYEKNNNSKFFTKKIEDVTGKEIERLYPEGSVKILVGCAPCQTFSQHTLKNKNREKDERWGLLYHFLRLIRESKPDIVSMENVPQLIKYQIFQDFVHGLEKEGYSVYHKIVFCPRYGIPQKRRRLVLLASKQGQISLIEETCKDVIDYPQVRGAISHLPKIKDGETCDKDPLHRSWKLSRINKKRIRQSKQGGSWKDWDKNLLLECHKKKKGSSFKAVYGRMQWNQPAPTVTTQFYSYGTGRFGHPTQHRALSLREGAILQTFPQDYDFYPEGKKISFDEIGRHIGNAVPVKLGIVIGESIKNHILNGN